MSERILVVAEHDGQSISSGTLAAIEAARQVAKHISGSGVDVLLLGENHRSLSESLASIEQVDKVLAAAHPALGTPLAECFAPIVAKVAEPYSHLLMPASSFGKDLSPRVAALLDVGQLSDVIAIESARTVIRPIYAGNALAKVTSQDDKVVITVRESAFDKASLGVQPSGEIVPVEVSLPAINTELVGQQRSESARPDLTSASVVVSGGRGVGSKENFALVESLADSLHAAIGASRAAVDAGYVSNDLQVGQTGKIVAPDLYIAVGISGAIQHVAGMKASKVVVAINSDPDAPIFEVADYGLVGDLFEILPKLNSLLAH
ncbi:electron transfer flavoprotein subunit alpha/FixB family protein [Vibrio sp. 16]|uniref:electron transfer flavoprotein subunit alpha/FixB family protein n=1 Tax=Vibrio sp. 16 TaxID=391586 RepID=UPI00018F2787|nr:FAD-binding protein [Vibrio sp. 16]EED26166.1 electron transfer flavoprotein [Vibrio sp. 16]CAK4075657.1 Electron transfer flavoprotein subunit alpha [Vibrio sp. 16]